MALKVRIEGGKYTIMQNDHGELRIDRGDVRGWLERSEGSKMLLIALACEVKSARKLLSDILENEDMYDSSEMLARIKKYMQVYQIEDQDCREGEI